MITYKNSHGNLAVFIGRKRVGTIFSTDGGFYYLPKGSHKGGETLPSIAAVKRSLEAP